MEHKTANPIQEVQELMNKLEDLTSNKSKDEALVNQFNQNLDQLSDTLIGNYHNLNSVLKEYNDRLALCQQAFVELPRNPFEKAVVFNDSDELREFLLSNDPDPYFIPAMLQKSTVLLEFLTKISPIIHTDSKFLIWTERALLDFDTQNWRVHETAPEVLKHLQKAIVESNIPNSRMVLHILRSLLLDFNQ